MDWELRMDIKSIFDEALSRGEKIKSEVVGEILNSKTFQDIISNKNFIKAVSTVIQTKDEVKRAISSQVKHIFQVMDVPSKDELLNVAKKLSHMEKVIEKIGRSRIAVSILPRLGMSQPAIKRATLGSAATLKKVSGTKARKSTRSKQKHRTAAKRKS
jgi:hypothetical protein